MYVHRGLGADCGTSPCTWFDKVWMRDACMNYTRCANPSNPLLTVVDKGLIVGGAEVVGGTVGGAVHAGVDAAVSSLFEEPTTGQTDWVMVAAVGLALVAGLAVVKKVLV